MPRLPAEIDVTDRVRIPSREIELSYARSGGPGGQHVNKTSTKVHLRWNAQESEALGDEDRARVIEHLGSRLSDDGELLLSSERHRDQSSNVDDAVEKLVDLLREALSPRKERKKTKPTRASRRRRLDEKRRRGDVKRQRRRVDRDD